MSTFNKNQYNQLHQHQIEIRDLIIDIDSIGDDFSCMVCCDIIYKKEMYQCSNGHVFCNSCWVESLKRKKECISCRVPINSDSSLSRNRALENLFLKTKVNCLYSLNQDTKKREENGCKEVVTIENFDHHIENCPFKIIDCQYVKQGCTERFKKGLLEAHLENCMYKFIKCQYCNQELSKYLLQDHIASNCPCTPIECIQKCGRMNIKRSKMNHHCQQECLNTVIDCKYKEGGCNKVFKRCDQYAHFQQVDHFNIMSRVIENQFNKINALNYMVKQLNYKLTNPFGVYQNNNNEIKYEDSMVVNNFVEYIDRTRLEQNEYDYSMVLVLGPFKVGITCTINVSRNEIKLKYEESSLIKDNCKLYFSLNNFRYSYINQNLFIDNTFSFEYNKVTKVDGWLSGSNVFKINFTLIYTFDK